MASPLYRALGLELDPERPKLFIVRDGGFSELGGGYSGGVEIGLQWRRNGVRPSQVIARTARLMAYMIHTDAGEMAFERAHNRTHLRGTCDGYRATQRARVLRALALKIRVVLWSPDGWVEVHNAQELDEAVARGAELYDDREDDECRPSDSGNPKRTSWSGK